MKKVEEKGKYLPGDVIYAKAYPDNKLIVRRYISRVYYCRFLNEPDRKELILFEREILKKEDGSRE